jgi:hypothetical protein
MHTDFAYLLFVNREKTRKLLLMLFIYVTPFNLPKSIWSILAFYSAGTGIPFILVDGFSVIVLQSFFIEVNKAF